METKPSCEELEARLEQLDKEIKNYRAAFNEIEDGYADVDLKGRIEHLNPALCRIFGYTANEMKELRYQELMNSETANKVYETCNNVFKTGVPNKSFEYKIMRKDGTKRIVEISVTLRKDMSDEPDGFRIILRDVTQRRMAEQELSKHKSRLEAIFRSVDDGIITVDSDMNIIDANKAAENICGFSFLELNRNTISDCQWDCCHACHDVIFETIEKKEAISDYEVTCKHQKRPHQKVILSSSPLLDSINKFTGVVLVIRDITRLSDLENELEMRNSFHNMIGKSDKMQKIYKLIEDLADFETTVLINGESGTGKELAARALHYSGNRSLKPFIAVNCSALSEYLLESELFGHVKGAFTGAVRTVTGRFEMAHTGTLLLDEIGDISPRIQLKLLRVLQEKTFERVGDSKEIEVDVRVITCTNQNMIEKVRQGEFREDLYYRIKVVELIMPSLRERKEDLPLLVDHFMRRYERKFNINIPGISDEVMRIFMDYSWPGNVRELEHNIERAAILCHGKMISIEHISPELQGFRAEKKVLQPELGANKSAVIMDALNQTDWNKAKAARLLGISRNTLYRKINKLGIVRS